MADTGDKVTGDSSLTIEIRLTNLMQMFNSFDPAPFIEKELDSNAEEYIISTVNEDPAKKKFRLVVHIPRDTAESEHALALESAIRNHFLYRAESIQRQFRYQVRLGRTSLLIAIAFLALCLSLREFLMSGDFNISPIISEGLLIAGWVAMWNPINTFLYDLYPVIRLRDMYRTISEMEIEVRFL